MNHSLNFFSRKKRSLSNKKGKMAASGGKERVRRMHTVDGAEHRRNAVAKKAELLREKATKKPWKTCLTRTLVKKISKGKGTINIWRQSQNRIAFISDGISQRGGQISRTNFQKVFIVHNCIVMMRGTAAIPLSLIRILRAEAPTIDARQCCQIVRNQIRIKRKGHLRTLLATKRWIKCKSYYRMGFAPVRTMMSRIEELFDFHMNFASFKEGIPQLFEIDGRWRITHDIGFNVSSYDCMGSGDWLASNYMEANEEDGMEDEEQHLLALKAIAEASKCTLEPNGGRIRAMAVDRDGTSSEITNRRLNSIKRDLTLHNGWIETPLTDEDIGIMEQRRAERMRAG